ncbi:NFU1 iron-sulfur cluster scaffold-like 2, partial [Homarus americanus]
SSVGRLRLLPRVCSLISRAVCHNKIRIGYDINPASIHYGWGKQLSEARRSVHLTSAVSMFIKVQETPNPNSLKFLPGVQDSEEAEWRTNKPEALLSSWTSLPGSSVIHQVDQGE